MYHRLTEPGNQTIEPHAEMKNKRKKKPNAYVI